MNREKKKRGDKLRTGKTTKITKDKQFTKEPRERQEERKLHGQTSGSDTRRIEQTHTFTGAVYTFYANKGIQGKRLAREQLLEKKREAGNLINLGENNPEEHG